LTQGGSPLPANRNIPLRISILKLIAEGNYPSEIARLCDTSRQNVSRYIKDFLEKGHIKLDVSSVADFYKITQPGLDNLAKLLMSQTNEALTTVNASSQPPLKHLHESFTKPSDLPRFDNLHNVEFKAKIKKDAEIWFPNETQLNNWVKKWGYMKGVLVEKTTQYVHFRMRYEASSSDEAWVRAYQVLFELITHLEGQYGMDLGHPITTRVPHHTIVGDSVAEEVSKHGPVYLKDVGHIDRSHDEGELEYYTQDDVKAYIRMPRTLAGIRAHQEAQQGQMNAITEQLDYLVEKAQEPGDSVPEPYKKKFEPGTGVEIA
jgi:predicted transcriptional regulator